MLQLFLKNGLEILPDIDLSKLTFINIKLFVQMIEYLLELGCTFYNIEHKKDIYTSCVNGYRNKLIKYIEEETPMYKDIINICIDYIYGIK